MNKQVKALIFLLGPVILLGCSTLESAEDRYKKEFEEGRRAERALNDDLNRYDNIRFASEKYKELIKLGNRYGDYGLARLLRKWYPEIPEYQEDAVKYFISCARRSSNTSELFPDTAMDSAFSVAAMSQLCEIALEDVEGDIVDSLHSMMSKVVTEEVRAWAYTMKTNAVSAKIYEDIISAVESQPHVRGYVKERTWDEIRKALINGTQPIDMPGGGKLKPSPKKSYEVVRFVKVNDTVDKCQYEYEVQLFGGDALDVIGKVQSAMRRQLVKEFLAAHPSFSVDDIGIMFPPWNHSGSKIKGTVVAMVMKMSVVRLVYDDATDFGKIAVRLGNGDVAVARKLAIENIEELATRENIVNVVGRRPPKGARYKVGKVQITKDGLLEIEFKCE